MARMPLSLPRSPLAHLLPHMRKDEAPPPLDRDEQRALARRLWHEHGVPVMWPELLNTFELAAVNAIARRLYGERQACSK